MRPADPSTRRIAYLPFVEASPEKAYTVRMRELLSGFGRVVPYAGLVATCLAGLRLREGRLACVVVNWTDNDLLDRRTRKIAVRKVVRVFARTIAMRLAARRLVFVRHNNYPHAVARGHEAVAARWVDRYERLFDAVLTHSGDERQRSRRYCPHPLYHRIVPRPTASAMQDLPRRYFVVFGRIVPYKKLEVLIDAFPADETLLIIGAIGDRTYAASLERKRRANILVRPGLLSEADAQALVAGAAALLIPHADGDVIVSGSFFYAMTLRVPVVAVEPPFLCWIASRVGPGLLRLAPDVGALCASLPACPSERADVEPLATAIVEREFGDATVREAMRRALDLPPV